jgi:glycerol-3-phosphate dehydrogenase
MISRTFDCYDHKQRDNIEGLVSIVGGKATTMRAMAEKAADLICRKTGRDIPCQTRETKLLHYRMFYKKQSTRRYGNTELSKNRLHLRFGHVVRTRNPRSSACICG